MGADEVQVGSHAVRKRHIIGLIRKRFHRCGGAFCLNGALRIHNRHAVARIHALHALRRHLQVIRVDARVLHVKAAVQAPGRAVFHKLHVT